MSVFAITKPKTRFGGAWDKLKEAVGFLVYGPHAAEQGAITATATTGSINTANLTVTAPQPDPSVVITIVNNAVRDGKLDQSLATRFGVHNPRSRI